MSTSHASGLHARWQLPSGLAEVLPPEGTRYEALRRQLLDLFDSWGYELVIPPLVEYLDSLLIGSGGDLDLQTFKLTDLESGRTLGVRADMTPQVARIDARQSEAHGINRLCYIGTVLRTLPDGVARSRSPVQVGAELYGHAGVESDVEVVTLMLETLTAAAIKPLHLELGHVGIFRRLAARAGLEASRQAALFEALQRKSGTDVRAIAGGLPPSPWRDGLVALNELHGDLHTLARAREVLGSGDAEIHAALGQLEQLAAGVTSRVSPVEVHIDLAELRGYHYHPGVVFAAYTSGHGEEIARGGRYDDIGAAFGRARPATGFSTDLRTLLLLGGPRPISREVIEAPADGSPAMGAEVRRLRAAGRRVVERLPGASRHPDCTHELQVDGGGRVVLKALD
ncbi:MAG: ATP phosphoribosyltransferase regulatory subunit [Pseudomonadota bacterium]